MALAGFGGLDGGKPVPLVGVRVGGRGNSINSTAAVGNSNKKNCACTIASTEVLKCFFKKKLKTNWFFLIWWANPPRN